MKTRILATLLGAALASWAVAADPLPGTDDSLRPLAPEQGQLEILLAPIALYPDALVALILPAATHPSEIVLAARFLSAGGKEEEIDAQVWDDSVKSLARFPEVVTFMDENLEWTQDVGDAFVAHPAEVMGAIQTLRARGARNGTLASTPQQEVVFEDDDTIRIIPAEPTVIYVPYYEPSILYPDYYYSYSYFPSSLVWFGVGYGIGSWLSYDCDWRYRTVWRSHHHRTHWSRDYDWRRRYRRDVDICIGGSNWNRWTPSTNYRRSRPRGDYDYSRNTVRTTRGRFDGGSGRFDSNTTRTESDRTRFESRRDGTSTNVSSSPTGTSDSRSVRGPDSLRTPTRIDRNDSTRTVDNRRDRTDRIDRNDRRQADGLTRYSERTPVETVTNTRRDPSTPAVQRRNEAPARRNTEATQRRPASVDRRPEVARTTPTARRDTPRPAASPAASRPAPQPARTITSGADIRSPQPARVTAPSPAPTRQVSRQAQPSAPTRVSTPAPARQSSPSYSAPSSAPARQPSYSAPRSETARNSPPPNAGSTRHRQVERNEN